MEQWYNLIALCSASHRVESCSVLISKENCLMFVLSYLVIVAHIFKCVFKFIHFNSAGSGDYTAYALNLSVISFKSDFQDRLFAGFQVGNSILLGNSESITQLLVALYKSRPESFRSTSILLHVFLRKVTQMFRHLTEKNIWRWSYWVKSLLTDMYSNSKMPIEIDYL